MKDKCSLVSEKTKQEQDTEICEIRQRWQWVESSIWTDKMLTALEKGVKGGKWFSLCDKIFDSANLFNAWLKVRANKGGLGIDNISIEKFRRHAESNILKLAEKLRNDSYRAQAVKRVMIDKPGSNEKRPLGIPTVIDRIVQTAIRNVIEPIFEKDFAEHSYGFRPGRGCKDALRVLDKYLKEGYQYVVDADLKGYFDTIPKDRLMNLVQMKIADGRVLKWIEMYLNQSIFDGVKTWTPETGTPQGAVLSPLLANIYLDPLDKLMANKGYNMIRYADDFIVICKTREASLKALEIITEWTIENGLILHPEKTKILDAEVDSIEFLGYRFFKGKKYPKDKSIKKYRDSIRKHTRRTNSSSLAQIIKKITPIMRGWFEYYKHSYKTTFPEIDGRTRRRLRSILKKYEKRSGIATTYRDNIRYPNKIFEDAGFFSLTKAHQELCRSLH